MQVGSLELELLLNRTKFDATLRAAEADAKRFGLNTNWKVEPEVDSKPLDQLTKSLDTGKAHLGDLNRYFKANPLTLQVDLSQLQQVHDLMGMSGTVSVLAEVKGSKGAESNSNSNCCDQLEQAITSNFSAVRDSLKEIADNTKQKGIIGKTIGTLAEGAVFGTTQAATRSFGEGISKGLERYFKTDFGRQGQGVGLGTGRNLSKANRIVDVASRELLGMPNGIRDLQKLAVNPAQKAFNNLADPKFYREIEDLIVYSNQKNSNPAEQAINEKLLDQARGKIQSRFIAQIEEDVIAVTRAMITLGSHPLRVRKRIKLGESAQQANTQEELFRSEYETKGIQERIAQSDSILHFVGGVAPNESKPGAPAVGTSHSMAAAMQAIFPDAFVDVTTPHNTVDPEQIKQGLYHQIVREQILPWLLKNKDTAASVMGTQAYSNLTNNLGQLHPLDAILQQNVDRGYNPDSIRLATKALASAQAFPEKDITLASASGGGFIVEEAIAILNEMAKRYPELQSAVKRIKSFAIGTPITGLTQTSRSGDADLDLAKYQAYIGSQDKVGKAMFGSKAGELQEELGLPLGTLSPDLNLQTVIQDWGLDHKVGEMIADLGKPISKFVVLLADFMNGNNQLTDGDAKNIVDLFNKAQNLKLGESFEDYVAEVAEIISGIAEVNRKIGGQIDVSSLKQFSSKLRKLPELDPEMAAQIPALLTGSLSEGLGINNIQGLGRRNQPGLQALSAVTVSNLIKDIVNQISKVRGGGAIYPEAEFDALDPNIADISTIETQLEKSALELNLPVGDSGSLVQLWKKQPPGSAPVRGYQDEFKELWQQVLAEVQKIVELDPTQQDRLFAEDGSLKHGNFLWDAAGIATQYKQPTYAEMHQQKSTKEFNTPVEQQYEKALLAFFALYEKEAEIYKRDYLEVIKQEKEAYLNGDPEASTRLQEILSKSKFSNVADIAKRVKVATSKSIAKKEILGSNTDYDLFSSFVSKFVGVLTQYEAGDRQDPALFQDLAKESFGINPQLDYLLAQATTGTGRIPEKIKTEDIKPDTTIALPHVKSTIEGIFEDLLIQGITDLKTASESIKLQSLNLDGINAILEEMTQDLEIQASNTTQEQISPIQKAKTLDNKDKYLQPLELDDNPFMGSEKSQLGGNNPLSALHQNTNEKLDQIISILIGVEPNTPIPEIHPPKQLELDLVPVTQDEPKSKLTVAETLETGLDASRNIVKSFVNGVIENFDSLYREGQKWEKAFLDLAPGQTGHLAKKAVQYTAAPIATTFAAQGIPGFEQAIALVHSLADLGLHDMAQGVANGVMDSISRTMPDVFEQIMDQLGNAPVIGDYFDQLRQVPQAIAEASSDYLIGNAGRTVADIGIGSGIIKGGKDAYDALGNRLNPNRLDAKEQELLDRVKDHNSVEYKERPLTADSPEIIAELETLKLEAGFQELEQAASATAQKLQELFSVEGLRQLAPMVDIPTSSLTAGDKPIKSAKKEDIANLIARMSNDADLAGAIANASPEMFLKQHQGMGKIKPEVDPQSFENLKRYWQEALAEINATPLEILDPEIAIKTLEGFATGYTRILNDNQLSGQQRESAGSYHGQSSELKSALQAYQKFGNIQDLEQKFTQGAVNAERHWGNTTADILKNFQILAAEAKTKGYDIQRFISEGSPGTTQRIREHWDNTEKDVKDNLEEIAQAAKQSGSQIESAYDVKFAESLREMRAAEKLYEKKVYYPSSKEYKPLEGRRKNRLENFEEFKNNPEGFSLEPYIAIPTQHLSSILKEGYKTGYRDIDGIRGSTTARKDAGIEDQLRPYYASPDVNPVYGAILPTYQNKPMFSGDIDGYGGISPLLIKLHSSILEKSTLTVGDSSLESRQNYYSEPSKLLAMFEEMLNKGEAYLEFQRWGKIEPHNIEQIYDPNNNNPKDFVQDAALEHRIPLVWQRRNYETLNLEDANNHSQLRTLNFASSNPLDKLERQFDIPADKAQGHWAKTATEILKQFDVLVAAAKTKGYDIQRFISEGSPGPSQRTRANWEKTAKFLKTQFEYIRDQAAIPGSQIEQMFAANPDLLSNLDALESRLDNFQAALANPAALEVAFRIDDLSESAIADSLQAMTADLDDIQLGRNVTFGTEIPNTGLTSLEESLSRLRSGSVDLGGIWEGLVATSSDWARTMQSGGDPLGGLEDAYASYAATIDSLPNTADIFSGISEFIDEMSAASPVFGQVVDFVKDLGISAVGIFGFYELSDAIVAGFTSLVAYEREFQRFKQTMAGAGKDANLVFEEIYDSSQEYGTSFKQSLEAYTGLVASTQGTNKEAVVDQIFPGFQQAFAAKQSTPEQQGRGFLAIEQLLSKSTAGSEELRQQLAEALPGSFAVAAQAMGMDMEAFTAQLKAGLVPADELLTRMANFYEIDSQIILEISAGSFGAELERITANVDYLKTILGELIIPALTPGLQAANAILTVVAHNSELIALILSGIVVGAVWQWVKSMTAVFTATKANVLIMKLLGQQTTDNVFLMKLLAQQTGAAAISGPSLMVRGLGVMRNAIALTASAAKAMWAAFGPSTVIMAGIYAVFRALNAGIEESTAAAKVAKKLNEENDKDTDPKKYSESFASSSYFERLKKNLLTIPNPFDFSGLDQIAAVGDIQTSIKESQKLSQSIADGISTEDFDLTKDNLSKNRGEQSYLNAQRLVATNNGDYEALSAIENQRADLKKRQEELLSPVAEKILLANKDLEQLNTQKTVLTEKIDNDNITQGVYDKTLEDLNVQIAVQLANKETYEAILQGVTTNIEGEFKNLQKQFDNQTWMIEGTLSQNTVDDINAKLAGEISPLELQTRTPLRKKEAAFATAENANSLADQQKGKILNQDSSFKQNALFALGLVKPQDYSEGLNGYDFDYIFESKLPELLNVNPETFASLSEQASEEGDNDLAVFLSSLGLYAQKTSDAAEANQNAAQAANDYTDQLKSNIDSYRDLASKVKDYARSQEDNQIERQRFIEDYPLRLQQAQKDIARSARDLQEKYDDFISGLEKQIIQAQLDLAQLDKQIFDNQIDLSIIKQFGAKQGIGRDVAQLYADYLKAVQPDQTIQLEQDLSRLDLETQALENSRTIRDLSTEKLELEASNLEQMRSLQRDLEDFNLQQKRLWEDNLDKWYDITTQSAELGVSLDGISTQVAGQGNNLISALNQLAQTLNAKAEEIRTQLNTSGSEASTGIEVTGNSYQRAANLLRQEEGFRTNAYWDTNAWRVGYGTEYKGNQSNSYKEGSTITKEAAETQLLKYDLPRFEKVIISQMGKEYWQALDANVQAALLSVAYNRGSLTSTLVKVAKTGDKEKIATAIAATDSSTHANRRRNEARLAKTYAVVVKPPIPVPPSAQNLPTSGVLPSAPPVPYTPALPPMPQIPNATPIPLPTSGNLAAPTAPPTPLPGVAAPTGKEAEAEKTFDELLKLEEEKRAKQQQVTEQEKAIALANLYSGLDQKQEEVGENRRDRDRANRNRDYDLQKFSAGAKGYLSQPEEIYFAGQDVRSDYQSRIDSLQEEQSKLMQGIEAYEALIAEGGLLDLQAKAGDQEAQDVLAFYTKTLTEDVDQFIANNKIVRSLQVEISPAVAQAQNDKTLELDFQKRADLLGMKSDALEERKSLAPSFIHDLTFNRPTRELGKQQIALEYEQKLKGLDQLKGKNGELTQSYKDAKKALDDLNEAKLDKLYLQTSELANIFDEVLQPALNGLLDDFLDKSVRASDAWRNFATSILNSLAQILMAFAKNELLRIIFGDSDKGVNITGKTQQKGGLNWGEALAGVTQQIAKPSSGVDISGKTKQKGGLNWGEVLGIGAGAAASAVGQKQGKAAAPTGGGFDWSPVIGAASNFIPLIFGFREGGDTEAMVIPHASQGLDTKDVALAKGLNEAIRKENHPDAFPAVLHKGEVVLSDLTGDAQLVRRLRNNGQWSQMKNSGYQSSKVENFRYGSESMIGSAGAATIINNFSSSVNVSAKDADSFRATESQIARRQKLMQERSKR